jgi:hypothetical protein
MNVVRTGLIKLRIERRRIRTTGTSRRRCHECGRKLSESRGSWYHIMRERRKKNFVSLWTKVGYYNWLFYLYTNGNKGLLELMVYSIASYHNKLKKRL